MCVSVCVSGGRGAVLRLRFKSGAVMSSDRRRFMLPRCVSGISSRFTVTTAAGGHRRPPGVLFWSSDGGTGLM